MKGMSMLSAIDLTCSDVEVDLGPKMPTRPFSEENVIMRTTGRLYKRFPTQKMTSFPLRSEGIIWSYENSLRVESHPGQQISGEKKIKLIDGFIDFRLVATLILLGSIYHLIKINI